MRPATFLSLVPLLLAGCGARSIDLPQDPVDRAATCGVVAAASARTATADVRAPLPFEAQGRILHYALLAASEGGEFQPDTANRISKRMSELQERIVEGKWEALTPACGAAFPPSVSSAAALPEARLDAQLACEALADFVTTALEQQESTYPNEMSELRAMRREVNDALAPGLRARAGAAREAQTAERHEALAKAARLGPPMPVLARCSERFE